MTRLPLDRVCPPVCGAFSVVGCVDAVDERRTVFVAVSQGAWGAK